MTTSIYQDIKTSLIQLYVDDDRVLVDRKRFDESGADELLLSLKVNTRIHLPADPNYWPDKTHLAWHRKHHSFESV